MIGPLPQGQSVFYGPNGILLTGGTVTTYIPKTTFAKQTWTSPTQTTANANPLTIGAGGVATLYGWGSIRQIVKDAQGNTIWDSPTFGGQIPQTTIVLATADGGVWTVPPGVYRVYVEAVGAGGAGSNCLAPTATNDVSGGGGGAGGFASGLYSVTPGQAISYSVGAGAPIGSQNPGGGTNFGSSITCGGGVGSSFSTQGTSVGGAGGTASGGTILNIPGGAGTDGSHIPIGGGGRPYIGPGNGGTSFYGPGGTSANGGDGNSGTTPGSGGGGAMDVNLQNITFDGGAGANGQILISYWG